MRKAFVFISILLLATIATAQPLATAEQTKLDTITVLPAQLWVTSNQANPPVDRIYRLIPAGNDSLWIFIGYDDTLHVGKELAEIVCYGAGFGEKPKFELYLFSLPEVIPDSAKISWAVFQRWGVLHAKKVLLGQVEYDINGPAGTVAPYGKKIRAGFPVAGKTYGFLVRRPTWNPNAIIQPDDKISVFAGIALLARKAGEGSPDLTAGLPGAIDNRDGRSWGNSNWNWFTMSITGLIVLLLLGAIVVFVYRNLLGKRA